jgi:hypothetical protein
MVLISVAFPGIYERNQMEMNIPKTIITGLNLDTAIEPIPEGFKVSYHGMKTVGSWAGTDVGKQATNANGDIPPHEIFGALAAFFNKVLRGEFMDSNTCTQLLFRRKLVLLDKSDGGLRPIGVLDTLMRLVSISANKKGIEFIGDSLQKHQFGLGMPNGCQMNYMHTDLAFNEGDTCVGIDQKNAFNNLRNIKVYEGLNKRCPGLIRYFRQQIHMPNIIENHKGQIMGYSYMSPTQGDACGSLFYCVGTGAVNTEILQEVK